jgi:RNA polymerase sigma-70 factor (ECF subfamily)
VLQETNLALWADAARVATLGNFKAWAYRVAFNQVLAYRKRQKRNRLHFNDGLLDEIAQDAESQAEETDGYKAALVTCSQKLPEANRRLLTMRYTSSLSIQSIASQIGSSVAAVSQSLYRIRSVLMKCIQDSLAGDGTESEGRS